MRLTDTSGEVITLVSIRTPADSITRLARQRDDVPREAGGSKASKCERNERAQIDRNTRPSICSTQSRVRKVPMSTGIKYADGFDALARIDESLCRYSDGNFCITCNVF